MTSSASATAPVPPAHAPPKEEDDPTRAEIPLHAIADILFLDPRGGGEACPASVPPEARIRCLYDARYKGDTKAASLAHEMFVKWNTVAGVEAPHTMDGGYRGMIKIEPHVPINDDRKHLEWVVASFRDFDQFFSELWKHGKEHGGIGPARPYRFRMLKLRFARSVNVNRPSAWAADWTIGYNVRGSINLSADQVRETMFHEIFHLNDPHHGEGGDRWWSMKALEPLFDGIVKKCGTASPCLAPYTPNETMVRGGTYYAFQPGNGVREYAAELALRYYREQRIALRALPSIKAFKCGPPENAKAWAAMKDEFFGGIDATPECK